MKFACPNPECGKPVGVGDRSCPRCGLAFSPRKLVVMLWRAGWRRVVRLTSLRCPACHQASPLTARACVACGQSMTFAAATEIALTPLHDRWHRWAAGAPPRTRRLLRWSHLLLSLAFLWWLLGYQESHQSDAWLTDALLSALYLAVFLLLASMLVSREVWSAVRGLYPLTRLALVINYFAAFLLMQNFIGTWRGRASILAGVFILSWLGGWLLCRLLWPVHVPTVAILTAGSGGGFDASDDQGRTVDSG